MLPLTILSAAQGQPMLVELKNGETLNGHLVQCDTWMNLTLKEVVQTNADGDSFMRIPEVYVKGNNIKYLRVPDEIIDQMKKQQQMQQMQMQRQQQDEQEERDLGPYRPGSGWQASNLTPQQRRAMRGHPNNGGYPRGGGGDRGGGGGGGRGASRGRGRGRGRGQ